MKTIKSLSNPTIRHIVKLHHPKYRIKEQQFIAEGVRTVCSFLDSQYRLNQLYISEPQENIIERLIKTYKLDSSVITIVSPEIMKKISTATTPSGILGVLSIPSQPSWENLQAGLVLAQIQDPGNMGTLIRTAAAVGIKTVVIIEGVDPWAPKVIQASAGTHALLSLFQTNWDTLLKYKKELKLYGLIVTQGESIKNIKSTQSLIVIGNEAQGLPKAWQEDCDMLITLPMPGKVESLNAAIAGSIALYIAHVYSCN